MTAVQLMRINLTVAQGTINDAMSTVDPHEMRRLAFRAASRIIEACQQSNIRPEGEQQCCPNPSCNRPITDHDPIFSGFCSTMCREGFNGRFIRAQRIIERECDPETLGYNG